jgi:Xaa-Pro aminopeptidase
MFDQIGSLTTQGLDRDALASALDRDNLDLAVVTSPENVFYLTGYPTLPTSGNPILYSLKNILPYCVVVERSGKRHLVCWGFSLQDVDINVEDVVTFNSAHEAGDALDALVRQIFASSESARARRVGVESVAPIGLVRRLELLDSKPDVVAILDSLLGGLRRRKSESEIELLRRSVEIAEGAIERVMSELKVGYSRLDAIRLAKSTVLELGGDGVGHVTMSFGHANPEIAIDERLSEGDLVVVDVGAKLDGYTSDARRYAYVGEIPQEIIDTHAAMVKVVADVAAHMRPGVTFAELMQLGREGFEQAGISALGRFNHVGHGIGLETEEEWIDDDPERSIEVGMVVAIELYALTDPYGQIGDEETYVIRPDGPELLSVLNTDVRRVLT